MIDSAAQWLAEVLNEQLIPSIITLNYGDQGDDSFLPWFQPARKSSKDALAMAQTLQIVLQSGIPITKAQAYELLDLAAPQDSEAVFASAPVTPAAQAPPDLGRLLAKLPLDAREYLMARILD